MKYGIWYMSKYSFTWKANCTSFPIKKYAMVDADIDDISRGIAAVIVRSNISTSNTNSMPAIGALNMPAIDPAAPHPNSNITFLD